jgi:hypothetical protein
VRPVKVHLHIISPLSIVFPIEMGRLSQMYIIEFFIRMIAQKLRVGLGHFVEAKVSVLGFLLILSFLICYFPCHIIIILDIFIS